MTQLIMFTIFMLAIWQLALAAPFDYFVLAQRWPSAHCESIKKCTWNKADLPKSFCLHGLWPSNFTEPTPEKCKNATYINIKEPALLKDMEKYWPDLEEIGGGPGKASNQRFWSGQWAKHGTCTEEKQIDYFKKAVEIFKKNNVLKILVNNKITPGSSYDFQSVISTLTTGIKGRPHLVCGSSQMFKELLLVEVRICYDKSGTTAMHCPQVRTNCVPDKDNTPNPKVHFL